MPLSEANARATRTRPPAAATASPTASTSRVLPIPASPVTTATRPSAAAATCAARSAASSASRPTIGSRAGARTSGGTGTAGFVEAEEVGTNRPSRISSYRSVVSARGATPSSRSSTATQDRYARIAPARSPDRARSAIRRRCASSSSASRSTRRVAATTAPARSPSASAATASRSRTSATVRSTATARVARQSSKSGLSRSENPARNGPRAASAAARSKAASGDPTRRLDRLEIDPDPVAVERRPSIGPRGASGRRAPSGGRTASAEAHRERTRRRTPATASPPARRARRAAPRRRAGRGWRGPCACRRASGAPSTRASSGPRTRISRPAWSRGRGAGHRA